MSLNNLAIHMAAQGRGPDRTLVHMSPREVQGLQALAMSHGGSLTINPVTGLPEAGFLDKFLPAIAGFALNTFAPGLGETVGGLFGLGSAAGTALTVGGISALSSGSLENGIMAGLGAYGGAGLAGNLGGADPGINARAANEAAVNKGLTDAARVEAAAAKPDVGAGLSTVTSKNFIKPNLTNIVMAAAPALLDQGQDLSTPEKRARYIREYGFNPRTGQYSQVSATPLSNGGAVAFEEGGSVNPYVFGGVRQRNYFIDPSDKRTDTQKSLDYLSGKKDASGNLYTNPFNPPEVPLPLDYATRQGGEYQFDQATNSYIWVPKTSATTSATTSVKNPVGIAALSASRDGGGNDEVSSNPGWDKMTQNEKAAYYAEHPTLAKIENAILGIFGKQNPNHVFVEDRTPVPVNKGIFGISLTDNNDSVGRTVDPTSFGISLSDNNDSVGRSDSKDTVDPTSFGISVADNNDSVGRSSADTSVGGGLGDGLGGGHSAGEGGFGDGGGRYAAAGGLMAARYASGGLGSLGGYSDGGQLLRGPGDGVSDSIPASIANKRPARLADGEFVISADVVSGLGNGSTEAGARQLYAMMDRVRKARTGTKKMGKTINAAKHVPA